MNRVGGDRVAKLVVPRSLSTWLAKQLHWFYDEFRQSLARTDGRLCRLKKLRFDNHIPHYQDNLLQLYYLLRYFPAHTLQYYRLYEDVASLLHPQAYRVLSLGCGAGSDGVGLLKVADGVPVVYTGVDRISWRPTYKNSMQDMRYLVGDALQVVPTLPLIHNVVVFPQSISEFGPMHFPQLVQALGSKLGRGGSLALVASFRHTSQTKDKQRLDCLADALVRQGSHVIAKRKVLTPYGVSLHNGYGLVYAQPVMKYLVSLYQQCTTYQARGGRTCAPDCRSLLSRYPVLSDKYFHGEVIVLRARR